MNKYIEKLQSKDEVVRKRMFAGMLFISMVIIGSIWIYNLGDRFNGEVKSQAQNDIKPFKLFANSLTDTYKNISASVGSISSIKKEAIKKVEEKQIDLVIVNESTNQ